MKYIILDIPNLNGSRSSIAQFNVKLADAKEMTVKLIEWEGWYRFDPTTTLLVFPGNGADILRSYLPSEWLARWRWTTVHAKRHWIPGEYPVVDAKRIFERGMLIGTKDIILIDDVVSSGTTAKQLRHVNEPWIPGVKWHIVAWMAQRARSLRGFASCYAPVETGSRQRKAPVNSLSTLLKDPTIAEPYAYRNFGPQAETFLSVLEDLRQECLHRG